ncbi:MAG: tetratricopeptide repeat protein [Allosphingosinicella sp.]
MRQWLIELADNPGRADRPFRLLLLKRHASRNLGWWSDLVTPRSFQEDGLVDLFDPPEPYLLPSIADESTCQRLVTAGVAAARARTGGNTGEETIPSEVVVAGSENGGSLSPGIEPLYLLMGAITSAANTASMAPARTVLAQHLARFELGRIEMLAEDRQLKGDFLCHMAAFISFAGGLALDRLPDAIAGEQAALHWRGAGDPPEVAEALRDALSETDSGRGRLVPAVLPELIGEALVVVALQKQPPEAQNAVVRRAWAIGGRGCITMAVRAAQDFADSKNHASLLWVDALSEAAATPAELMAISDQLPERTTCMIERAAEVDRRLVEAHRSLAATDDRAETRLTFAHCLTRLASRLRDICHLEDALAAAAEAVAVHRAVHPSEAARLSAVALAEALLALGGAACDLGRCEEALAASSEAVQLLLGETHAAARRSRAHALSIMASHLSDLGRRDEALAAAEESVRLHRDLAAAQPDTETPPLALALLNLAYCRSDVGRNDDALAAADDSVRHLAGFARTKPDAYLPGYAQALNIAAVHLARTGRLPEALDRSREAIAIQRSLTEACPEAYRPDLAMMLNGFANALRQSGDMPAALAALDEAVALLKPLAVERPQAYQPQLAKQLNNQSMLLIAFDAPRALDLARDAVVLLRDAAAKRPDRHNDDLATRCSPKRSAITKREMHRRCSRARCNL